MVQKTGSTCVWHFHLGGAGLGSRDFCRRQLLLVASRWLRPTSRLRESHRPSHFDCSVLEAGINPLRTYWQNLGEEKTRTGTSAFTLFPRRTSGGGVASCSRAGEAAGPVDLGRSVTSPTSSTVTKSLMLKGNSSSSSCSFSSAYRRTEAR